MCYWIIYLINDKSGTEYNNKYATMILWRFYAIINVLLNNIINNKCVTDYNKCEFK